MLHVWKHETSPPLLSVSLVALVLIEPQPGDNPEIGHSAEKCRLPVDAGRQNGEELDYEGSLGGREI